jgi:hypothetical protein
MKIVFTKGSGKYDRMDVFRDGADCETIQCPKQRILPHDLVHYAVESTLRRRGFLSRVRDGEAASFQMQADAESDGVERLVEVFQGDAWSGGDSPAGEMLDLYRVTCQARACPELSVGADDIAAVRACMRALDAEWDAVAVGGSLTVEL